MICGLPYAKQSHGLNVQFFGQGVFWLFNGLSQTEVLYSADSLFHSHSKKERIVERNNYLKALHDGTLISPFGVLYSQINGINLSLGHSEGHRVNGFSFSLLRSAFNRSNGLSFALVNQAGTV